jgi:ABC-type uncharacterized transport system permease subunit
VFSLSDRQCFGIAVILYGIAAIYSIFLLRREVRKDNRVNYILLATAFVAHTGALLLSGFSLSKCPITTLYGATTFVTWLMVLGYLIIGLFRKLRFVGAFAAPLLFAIGVFALFTPRDIAERAPNYTGGWFPLHIALFTLSYAAFGLSAVAGAMYLSQERDLKLRKLRAIMSLMPPIQRLELVTSRLLVTGFVLLTLGLAVSAAFVRRNESLMVPGDFKVLWSAFVWAIYLGLIVMRWKVWRGRKFAIGAIGAFAFVLLTFWGSSLMSPTHRP